MNLIETIQEAEIKALENNISENSILLNDKYDICKEFVRVIRIGDNLSVNPYPPMLLGKKVLLVNFLPENYAFALTTTNAPVKDDITPLLKKYVVVKNGQLMFKNISSKKNIKDFERIVKELGL